MNNPERKSVFSDIETPKKSGERQEKPASRNTVSNPVRMWMGRVAIGVTLGLGILGVTDNASAFDTNVKNVSQAKLKKAASENNAIEVMRLLIEELGYQHAGWFEADKVAVKCGIGKNPLEAVASAQKSIRETFKEKKIKGEIIFDTPVYAELASGEVVVAVKGQPALNKAAAKNDGIEVMRLLIEQLGYQCSGDQNDMSLIKIVQEQDGESPEDTLKRGRKNVRKTLIEKKMREDKAEIWPGGWKTYKLEGKVEYKATHARVNGKLMAAIWGKIKPKSNRRGSRGVKGESMDGNFSDTVTARTRRQALWKAAKKKEMSIKDFKKKFQIKKSNKKGIWVIERIIVQVAQNETQAKKEILPQSKAPDTQKELPKAQSPIKKMTPSMKKKLNPKFKFAYNSTLKRYPDFRGKLNIFISINEKGRVTKLEVEGKGEAHKDFKITLMKKIKNLRFPSDENPMRIEIPYNIAPSNY